MADFQKIGTWNVGRPATIRPFTRELRKQGFEFCYCDRGGGDKVTEFAKRQGDRTVKVQFWRSGLYRASHGTHSQLPSGHEGCCETTRPAIFKTVPEMLKVVEAEWSRPSTAPPQTKD